jgi:subtilisin family serine protease
MHRQVMDMMLAGGVIHASSIGNLAGDPANPVPFQMTTPANVPAPWRHPDQTQEDGGVSAVMACGGIELDDTLYSLSSLGPSPWEDITLYDPGYPHDQESEYFDYPYGGFGGGSQGLIKPDVVAYTNVLTTTNDGEYLTFAGTSAAAPHLGGAYALLLSASPGALPRQISQALQRTAIDMGTPGKDSAYGAGRIQVKDAALRLFHRITSDTIEPSIGGTYTLTASGFPGEHIVTAYSLALGSYTGPEGTWDIAAPLTVVHDGVLDESGTYEFPPIEIPDDEGLIGLQLHYQSVADDTDGLTGEFLFSPVETITIRP